MYSRHQLICFGVASLLIAAFLILGGRLGREIIWSVADSLHTAERSRQMLVSSNPLTVKRNFYRDHNKPPLQYWLTAPFLKGMTDKVLALLVWPLAFGALTLVFAALLAGKLQPLDRGLPLWTMTFLASSTLLLICSSVALLDTGMVAFLLLTGFAYETARKDPRAWWLVGAGIALGFLQKVPLGILLLGLILLCDHCQGIPAAPRSNLHFRRSWKVWTLLALIWPVYNAIFYPSSFLKRFLGVEMMDRVNAKTSWNKASYWSVLEDAWEKWPYVASLALLGFVFFWVVRKKEAFRPLLPYAVFLAAYLSFVTLFLFHREKYLLPAFPFIAFFAAWLLYRLPLPSPFRAWPAGFLCLALSITAFRGQWPEMFKGEVFNGVEQKEIALQREEMGHILQKIRRPEEPVVMLLGEDDSSHFISAMSYFSAQPDPINFWTPKQLAPDYKKIQFPENQPFLLLVRPADIAPYPGLFKDQVLVQTVNDYAFYRCSGARISQLRQREH